MKVYIVLHEVDCRGGSIELVTDKYETAREHAVSKTSRRHPDCTVVVKTTAELNRHSLISDGWYICHGESKDFDFFDYFIEEWEVTDE